MFEWKKEYEVGVDLIDGQHKELFRIAEKAYQLLNNYFMLDKFDKIMHIIDELRDYCAYHFESEEKYQLEVGYRKFFSHKAEHDYFISKFKDVDHDKIDENQELYIAELLEFFLKWISEHIIEKDMFINAKA